MKATIARGWNWRFLEGPFPHKATVLVPVNFAPFNEVVGKSPMFSLFVQPRNFPFVAVLFGMLCATCLTMASDNSEPSPLPDEARIGGMTREEAQDWWSFQPVGVVNLPLVQDVGWPLNPIDHFVLAQLEKRKLSPSATADRHALIRRTTFNLTGLPPTPSEVEKFVNDSSRSAFADVVQRLLSSPAYGQRWARHWLDVVRYADYHDSNAKARQRTSEPLDAWRYRDWVVDALNQDMPFNQFIVHQIAGDLLPSPTGEEVYPPGLIATTFLSNGVWDPGDADKEKIISDIVDDNIDTIGKSFLGLTLGCARCHDHKFDPVSTEDYYRLAGIFYSSHIIINLGEKGGPYTINRVALVPASEATPYRDLMKKLADTKNMLAMLNFEKPKRPEDDPERLRLVARRDALEQEMLAAPRALAVQEGGTPGGLFPNIQDVPIHIRGSYTRLGQVVPRGLPRFFVGDGQPTIAEGSGRWELAQWVASSSNSLTARVIVNRVWQWHFGTGLVRTPNNFGKLGEAPSHPGLLDWLTAKFVEDGWSLKKLHQRILLSATYQQADYATQPKVEQDPDNHWLGRFASRRLEAEEIRDAMLAVTGRLDLTAGGPACEDFTIRRRSLYIQTARWKRDGYAIMFDAANPDASTEKRTVSTIAPQALLLLNHPFVLEQASHLAKRLIKEVPHDDINRIHRAYQLLFARQATANDIRIARQVVADGTGWQDWAHVLLCSNEFVYVD